MSFDPRTIPDQSGRTAVVTGANTGIGFHNARDLAAAGAHVVLACRSEERALAAIDAIRREVDDPSLEFIELDLASLDAVRAFAASFRAGHDRLDLLINNAGVMWVPLEHTDDGLELHMAANYFGHALLTSLLLDLMSAPPDAGAADTDVPSPRVVSLSSLAHAGGAKKIRFDDVNWSRANEYRKHTAYAQSKLACLMFAFELDRRLRDADNPVRSLAAHPGVSQTELGRNIPTWAQRVVKYTVGPFVSHEPRQASLPTLMAAVDPSLSGGEYIGPTGRGEMLGPPGFAKIHECARRPDDWARLWDLTVEETGATFTFA